MKFDASSLSLINVYVEVELSTQVEREVHREQKLRDPLLVQERLTIVLRGLHASDFHNLA